VVTMDKYFIFYNKIDSDLHSESILLIIKYVTFTTAIMDLTQKKLSKAEWLNVEIPVSDEEKEILQMIIRGYSDINIKQNNTSTIMSIMKIENTPENAGFLYQKYFEKDIGAILQNPVFKLKTSKGSVSPIMDSIPNKKMKKAGPPKNRDLIRINSMDAKLGDKRPHIFEFLLIDFCKEIVKSLAAKTPKYTFYLYTLIQFRSASIQHLNPDVMAFVNRVIAIANDNLKMMDVIKQSYEFIEKNPYLLKYQDKTLFAHQKELFSIFRQSPTTPKLVLYVAPTGTGKTLSPIGLSEGHRVIFICAARHIGLALAKSAVSVGKRIGIAFGCETADDIRLHYFAASVYTRNARTGGIGKVDNSVGDKVQIMICDIQSYLVAMYYMLAFSPRKMEEDAEMAERTAQEYVSTRNDCQCPPPDTKPVPYYDDDLITYWDEPTITMDYSEHPLHDMIRRNWSENKISKMVLSSATLPNEEDITETIHSFKDRFSHETPEIHTISSYDCRKSISLLNKSGKAVVPHLLFRDPYQLKECARYCTQNKSLLRYFDLPEIVRFIEKIHMTPGCVDDAYNAENYFADGLSGITMNNIKIYYLNLLRQVGSDLWPAIHNYLVESQDVKIGIKTPIRKTSSLCKPSGISKMTDLGSELVRTQSMAIPKESVVTNTIPTSSTAGILLTTKDAHTLTDGPTIYLTEDVEKVGRFCIQQSNIPTRVFAAISEKIAQNNVIQGKIDELTRKMEDQLAALENKEQNSNEDTKGGGKSKNRREVSSSSTENIKEMIDQLRSKIQFVSLDKVYIPNTVPHQQVWLSDDTVLQNAFVPHIDESSVREIMELSVTDQMKLLLLMGIGTFIDEREANPRYMEIMKKMAYSQQLFIIIASSDYIYGTNYQFCHGFIGKDLEKMTHQKTIQAMGRIGRNQIQQTYTIRFREDAMLFQLFKAPLENLEAIIMSRLLS